MESQSNSPAKFNVPSILAIVCAVASFNVGAVLGFVLAFASLCLGAIGLLLALSPQVRGGVISMLAILGGSLGVIAAVIKAVAWLF